MFEQSFVRLETTPFSSKKSGKDRQVYENKYGISEADLDDLDLFEDENIVQLSKQYAHISRMAEANKDDIDMADEDD